MPGLKPSVGDPRGRRYDMATVSTVRRMYAHGEGWGKSEIQRYLAKQGMHVHYNTLMRWLDEGFAERVREENRERETLRRAERRQQRNTTTVQPRPRDAAGRVQRMCELKALGLSMPAVAAVMSLDFPDEVITAHQVRRTLATGKPPRPYRKLEVAA